MKMAKSLAHRLPLLGRVMRERDELRETRAKLESELKKWRKGFVAPGHFYSPIVDIESYNEPHDLPSGVNRPSLAGIELNESKQLALLDAFIATYSEHKFHENPTNGSRYHLDNEFYAYSDGICLYSMLRHIKPKKFVEIGSGFSSACALDVNDQFFDSKIDFTFIEPYPDRLQRLLTPADHSRNSLRVIQSPVQSVPISVFKELESNDILFVDSSHVSKTSSDVNFIFFDILPALKPGVHVHFHDIFFPFEYPSEWIRDGRSWNEAYLLRAFLQFNSTFEVVYFNSFIESLAQNKVALGMPLSLNRPTHRLTLPGSIWLRRTGI